MANDPHIDNLPEAQLETTLSTAEADLESLKSSAPQFIDGSDIVNFISNTGNAFDFTGILSQDPGASTGNSKGVWIIEATGNHAQTLYATILVTLYVDGSLYSADVGFFDLTHPGSAPINRRFVVNVYDVSTTPPTATNVKTAILIITGDTKRTVSWNVNVMGLDTSSIKITRLS